MTSQHTGRWTDHKTLRWVGPAVCRHASQQLKNNSPFRDSLLWSFFLIDDVGVCWGVQTRIDSRSLLLFYSLTGSVLQWAETYLTGQSVVMVTGLPLGGYRHLDLVNEVWPYFVEKDISRVFYHVVILPLQRRVRTHTHKLFPCHASPLKFLPSYYYVLSSPPLFFRLASFSILSCLPSLLLFFYLHSPSSSVFPPLGGGHNTVKE